jgi:hypothetical protein
MRNSLLVAPMPTGASSPLITISNLFSLTFACSLYQPNLGQLRMLRALPGARVYHHVFQRLTLRSVQHICAPRHGWRFVSILMSSDLSHIHARVRDREPSSVEGACGQEDVEQRHQAKHHCGQWQRAAFTATRGHQGCVSSVTCMIITASARYMLPLPQVQDRLGNQAAFSHRHGS